jgi:hypothetical protein
MKTILIAVFFFASSAAHAQRSCDDLKGLEKQACLKQGGTVKANTAAGGSSSKREKAEVKDFKDNFPKKPHRLSGERYAEPGAPTDYTKPDEAKQAPR